MSVYRRQYHAYGGALTPERSRFLVVVRYALDELLGSRMLMAFLLVALLPVLAEAVLIYLAHNPVARALVGLADIEKFLRIDSGFFYHVLSTQCFLGLILTAWVGPGLIAADLAGGALPLYLSRPFSRAEYVLGKAAVLVVLLSGLTWIPGLLLYLLNAALAEGAWGMTHVRIPFALIAGSFGWISVVGLFALSLSAWIKWRLAASAMLFGVFFVSAGLGETVAVVLRVSWGRVFSLNEVFEVVWAHLLGSPHPDRGVPLHAAWLVLAGLCGVSLWVLHHRLRAREMVR